MSLFLVLSEEQREIMANDDLPFEYSINLTPSPGSELLRGDIRYVQDGNVPEFVGR